MAEGESSNWTIVADLQIVTYVTVAFFALLAYDWIISLAREVTRIWHSRWSLVKVLYLYARYSPFVPMVVAVQERFSSTCYEDLMTFTTVFSGVGIAITDIILLLRTYSIYNKSRKILAIFTLSWIIVAALGFWAIANLTGSFRFKQTTTASHSLKSSSCFLAYESDSAGLVCYMMLLAVESVITLLTVWKTFDTYRKSGFHFNQIVSMIYCEGLFYYFMILPITITNVVVLLHAPMGLLLLLDSPLTVMHSILCCRLVLHVREVSEYNAEDEEDDDDLLPTFFIVTVMEPYMSTKQQHYYV